MLKVNKKILLLSITLMMLLSTTIYAYEFGESQVIEGPITITNNIQKYEPMSIQGFRSLTTDVSSQATGLTELKKEMNRNFKNYETSFSIFYNGNTANLIEEIKAIINEIENEDEYFSGTYSKISYGYEGVINSVTISINVEYLTNKSQELFVDSKVKNVVEKIIKPGMSDLHKAKAVNDWIVLNTEYSEVTNSSPHAAYTLFNEGKGVCQAYALSAYRLLEEAGLQVRYVTGVAGDNKPTGVPHAWNQVRLNGTWYNLDTTWNDPMPDRPGQVSYDYFLISDGKLNVDHFPDNERVYEVANDNRYENVDFHNFVDVGIGYTMLPLNEKQSNPKYMWKVRLNKPLKTESVNFNSVYVHDEFGVKLDSNDFNIKMSNDNPALININIISGSGYLKNRLYYLVVEKTLQSLDNKYLVDPIKMPFIIK